MFLTQSIQQQSGFSNVSDPNVSFFFAGGLMGRFDILARSRRAPGSPATEAVRDENRNRNRNAPPGPPPPERSVVSPGRWQRRPRSGPEPLHRRQAQPDEQRENQHLRRKEGRLLLRRGQGDEGGS